MSNANNEATPKPLCGYCNKPIETPHKRKIISRPPRGEMTFCSPECGLHMQWACEG